MTLVEGATYAINPDPLFIPPTSNDASLTRGAVYTMRFEEFFDAAVRGDVDRMFLSGGQIDGAGNTNVTAIGPARPKVKLGGGGGGCNLAATIRHLTLWTTRHRSGRTLVETCDFITDMGHVTPLGTRAELGYAGGGPEWLVTELGVFDFPAGQRAAAADLPRCQPGGGPPGHRVRPGGRRRPPPGHPALIGRARRAARGGPARGAQVGVFLIRAVPRLHRHRGTGLRVLNTSPAPDGGALDAVFAPRRIALVGASDRSGSVGRLSLGQPG